MEIITFEVEVPQDEVRFFRKLAKKMGWTVHRQRKKKTGSTFSSPSSLIQ